MGVSLVERLYTRHDLPALRRLWEGAYDPESVHRREAAFRWVTEGNPVCPQGAPRHLIMDGDSVAGTLGCMPTLVRAFDRTIEMHFSHDLLVDPQYRGLGLANVDAALDVGVRRFDASLGGLGGCPYAPGASGNIVTDDLVFMLESMGLRTGIDLDQLLETRRYMEQHLNGEPTRRPRR